MADDSRLYHVRLFGRLCHRYRWRDILEDKIIIQKQGASRDAPFLLSPIIFSKTP